MTASAIQQERGIRPAERPTPGYGSRHRHPNLPFVQIENTMRPCVELPVHS